MASKTAKTKKDKSEKKEQKNYFYFDQPGQNQEFSDFVRLSSFPRGILLSFGRWTPEQEEFGIFKEILLPFDTAEALSVIIQKHIEGLEKKKVIKRVDIQTKEK